MSLLDLIKSWIWDINRGCYISILGLIILLSAQLQVKLSILQEFIVPTVLLEIVS